jgi:ferredoxin-type protein NapH
VALAFIAIPVLNRLGYNFASGNLLALDISGFTLADPLAALQVMAGTPVASLAASLCRGAALVLLLAALAGPLFCGWLCPFGFMSELVFKLRHGKTRAASGSAKAAGPAVSSRLLSVRPFICKLLITGFGLLAVLLYAPLPWLNQFSMPGWYSRAMQHLILYSALPWGALLLPAVLALEALAGKRFWCRYICPQSVLIALAGLLLPKRLRVSFTRKNCTCSVHDRPCLTNCSLTLNPRAPSKIQLAQCNNCGDCVDACQSRGGALHFAITADKTHI